MNKWSNWPNLANNLFVFMIDAGSVLTRPNRISRSHPISLFTRLAPPIVIRRLSQPPWKCERNLRVRSLRFSSSIEIQHCHHFSANLPLFLSQTTSLIRADSSVPISENARAHEDHLSAPEYSYSIVPNHIRSFK